MHIFGKKEILASRADYYPNSFTQEEYKKQLELILHRKDSDYLYCGEKGFQVVSLAWHVFEVVKSFFGLRNRTEIHFVNSQVLKFLYYGKTHDILANEEIHSLVKNIRTEQREKAATKLDKSVQDVAMLLTEKTATLAEVRQQLTAYHQANKHLLVSSWLASTFAKTHFSKTTRFGETYLMLAQREFNRGAPSTERILYYMQEALLCNEEKEFQQKLSRIWGANFKMVNSHTASINLFRKILDVAVISNHLDLVEEVIKGMLDHFVNLEAVFADSSTLLCSLSDVHLERNQIDKVVKLYELLIPLYVRENKHEEAAKLSFRLGEKAMAQKKWKLMSNPDYLTATRYFSQAYSLQKQNSLYRKKLKNTVEEATQAVQFSWRTFFTGQPSDQMIELYKIARELALTVPGGHIDDIICEHEKKGEYELAVQFYEEMQKLWPEEIFVIQPKTFLLYAEMLVEKQEYVKAVRYYELSLQSEQFLESEFLPGYHLALFKSAAAIEDLSIRETKLKTCEQMVAPEEPLHNEIVDALFKVRVALAEQCETRCKHSFDTECHEERKKLLVHKQTCKKDAQAAVDWYKQALEVKPDDPKLHFQVAELYGFFDIDIDEALTHYRLALKENKENLYYRRMVANCHRIVGNEKSADRHYNRLQESQNDDPIFAAHFIQFTKERFKKDADKIFNIDPH